MTKIRIKIDKIADNWVEFVNTELLHYGRHVSSKRPF